ncbi:MAG: alanine racemase [bacterium]
MESYVDTLPTAAEIDLNAIAFNLRQLQTRVSPAKIMAVVKSNAYGHGLKPIAEMALAQGVEYFGVARLEEGVALRKDAGATPILVFGGFFKDQVARFLKHDLELTLFDEQRARILATGAKRNGNRARAHIKVDTGMERVGISWQHAADFVCFVKDLDWVDVVGVYTHFATSDEKDKTFARTQLERFERVLLDLHKQNVKIPLAHAANSGAILDIPGSYFDMVRPGVSLYGYYPSLETSRSVRLQPAMTLKSRVMAVKEVAPGSTVSYGQTYRASRKTRIATVAIGYGDGYNRLLSNLGEVLIHGRRFPVVGRVCMDHIMVDITDEENVDVGDEVVVLGTQGGQEISIYELCEKLQTIPYEVTCRISERVPRVYKHDLILS